MIVAALQSSILFFFHQEGCPACAEGARNLEEFQRVHPTTMVSPLNITRKPDWQIQGYVPKMTPAYALVTGGKLERDFAGTLTAKQLEDFIAGTLRAQSADRKVKPGGAK